MKRLSTSAVLLAIVSLTLSVTAHARDYYIEEPGWHDAPSNIAKLMSDTGPHDVDCKPYQVLAPADTPSLRFVIPATACWGASATKLFVVSGSKVPALLIEDVGTAIGVKSSKSATPDVVVTDGHAAYCSEHHWHFDGRKYRVVKTVNCLGP